MVRFGASADRHESCTAEAYATIAEATITDADRAMAAARRVVNQGLLSDVRPAVRTEWMLKRRRSYS